MPILFAFCIRVQTVISRFPTSLFAGCIDRPVIIVASEENDSQQRCCRVCCSASGMASSSFIFSCDMAWLGPVVHWCLFRSGPKCLYGRSSSHDAALEAVAQGVNCVLQWDAWTTTTRACTYCWSHGRIRILSRFRHALDFRPMIVCCNNLTCRRSTLTTFWFCVSRPASFVFVASLWTLSTLLFAF